ATPTPLIYTLSLHDALPISTLGPAPVQAKIQAPKKINPLRRRGVLTQDLDSQSVIHTTSGVIHSTTGHSDGRRRSVADDGIHGRSEEHTSELQSRENLVCRL